MKIRNIKIILPGSFILQPKQDFLVHKILYNHDVYILLLFRFIVIRYSEFYVSTFLSQTDELIIQCHNLNMVKYTIMVHMLHAHKAQPIVIR